MQKGNKNLVPLRMMTRLFRKHRVKWLFAAILTIAISISSSVFAESPASAIKAFGLVGTWSDDCVRNVDKISRRTMYAAPLFGSPTLTHILEHHGNSVDETIYEIESAERISDDKIQLHYVKTRQTKKVSGKITYDNSDRGDSYETILERLSNKIRILSSNSRDGKIIFAKDGSQYFPANVSGDLKQQQWNNSHTPTPLMEKCLN